MSAATPAATRAGAAAEPTARPGPPSSREQLGTWWLRTARAIHVVTGASLVAAMALLAGHWWPGFVAVAVLGALYATVGHRALTTARPRDVALYLPAAWACVLVASAHDSVTFLLVGFVAYPHTWSMLGPRVARPVVVASGVALGVESWLLAGRTTGAAWDASVGYSIVVTSSLLIGAFQDGLAEAAHSRAAALDELRETQARLVAAERTAGILEERERLSRDVHDTLAQSFASIIAQGRAARASLDAGDVATAGERLDVLLDAASEGLSEARIIVAATTPGHLADGSLGAALDRLAETLRREGGIDAEVVTTGIADADPAADLALYRVAQEVASNIRRHSGATLATFVLTRTDTATTLEMTDDGRGFDPAVAARGFGLDGMRSRVEALGGAFAVTSSAGQGTTVRAEIPR